MFEKFYTTKMSTNGRELRLRFEKIRRGRGRFTRLAGSVMAAVMLITLTCATIAMAAVGTDRPEHWDKNEYYYVCGMNFSIDVSGAAVPEWVNALAGGSGKLEISLSKCQMRDTKGYVSNSYLGSFAGEGDSVLFEAQAWTVAPDGDEPYVAEYCGNFENMTNNFNIVPDDGRRARMTFGVDENQLIDSV